MAKMDDFNSSEREMVYMLELQGFDMDRLVEAMEANRWNGMGSWSEQVNKVKKWLRSNAGE